MGNTLKQRKVLFIDRDGTLICEPADEQIDSFEKLEFYPEVITYLGKIVRELDFELVMITNQDGLGTDSFPEITFWPVQEFIISSLENEGIAFVDILIDRTFPEDNAPTRKPGTGLLQKYLTDSFDLKGSYVIGDRLTDIELARNLDCGAIFLNGQSNLGSDEISSTQEALQSAIALETGNWKNIYEFLALKERMVKLKRETSETTISIQLNLDGSGKGTIDTGIAFFDHMLDQLMRHGQLDLEIKAEGDLEVDEHHTIEDTGIALGEAFNKALGDKLGMERYGFCLPMDDALAQVAIDFGGRNWLVWEADFKREMIGKMPTEMFSHFFKSFTDGARANLHVRAEGTNEHHKIEAIFKAFAKAIKMAVKRDAGKMVLPSTKGIL
ncbi:MAG: bifunctional histidinol-phosphatase/imidazoleglycerol-phosphate dehydratase HisB [Flavobacteriaceae bacterium]